MERLPSGKWPQRPFAVDKISDVPKKPHERVIAEQAFHSAVQIHRRGSLDESGILPKDLVHKFLKDSGASVKLTRILRHRDAQAFYDGEMFERFVMSLPSLTYDELRKAVTGALEGDPTLTTYMKKHGQESVVRMIALVSMYNSYNKIQ